MERRRTRIQQSKRYRKRDAEPTAETAATSSDRLSEVIEDTKRIIDACEDRAPADV